MKITEFREKESFETALLKQNNKEFLQSYSWGEFEKLRGKEVIRLGLEAEGVLCAVQVFIQKVLFFRFATIVRMVDMDEKVFHALQDYLKKEKACTFVRIEPIRNLLFGFEGKKQIKNRQWKHSLILDLEKSEEELLGQMHSKTRYNIRLAGRKGVVVDDNKDFEIFWKLNEDTQKRDGFKSHDKAYYKDFAELEKVHQLNASFEGDVICSGLLIHYGDRFTYVHGASGNKHRNLMAPYLLQMEAIKKAKQLGAKEYDFGGIAKPMKDGEGISTCFHNLCWDVKDSLTGVTRFKAGFGGEVISYGDAFELALSGWKYRLFLFLKKLRG